MTVWVIGGCQASGLARCISALTGIDAVKVLDVRRLMKATDDGIAEIAASFNPIEDLVVHQMPDATGGKFGEDAILATGCKVVPFPVFSISSYHPDCIYFRLKDHNIQSPLLDYNSAIVAAAHIEGLSVGQAETLFNAYTYASVGYLAAIEAGEMSFRRRMHGMGHDYQALIARHNSPFMHSINHPKIWILFECAKIVLSTAGIPMRISAKMPDDELAMSAVWPVYPEIAKIMGLPGGLTFQAVGGATLSLREFIKGSYKAYDDLDLNGYVAPAVDRARDFIRREVRIPAARSKPVAQIERRAAALSL